MFSTHLKYLHEKEIDLKSDSCSLLSTTFILNFLNDKELLLHRLTCKMTYIATQKISGPYESMTQFLLGSSQYFSSMTEFKSSWEVYKKCKNTDQKNIKPALLYKSNDPAPVKYIHLEFPEGENVFDNGRVYQVPLGSYTWKHNTAWILGNIHIHRPFLISSPLIRKFIFREDQPQQFSAWSKEIVGLCKVGYQVTNIYSKGYIKLSPGLDNHKINIKSLNADNKEIEITLKKMLNDVYQKNWVLMTDKKPTLEDFKQFVFVIRKENEKLNVFWVENGKILNKKIPNNINPLLLPKLNESSDRLDLIEYIRSYGCIFTKKNPQKMIANEIHPSRCIIL